MATTPGDDGLPGTGDSNEVPLIGDQRGFDRVIDLPGISNAVGGLDIGAFELVDTTPPNLTAPADISLEGDATGGALQASAADFLAGATAVDDLNPMPTITNDVPAVFPVGTTTVTFTADDGSGNLASATATVTVTDTTDPVVTAPGDISVQGDTRGGASNTGPAIAVFLSGASGTDIVDDSLTITHDAPLLFPLGNTVVIFTGTDDAGNTGTASATVTVVDTTAPAVTVPADITVEANVAGGAEATLAAIATFLSAATATDTVDANPTIMNDAPMLFPVGDTSVTFTATDESGNSALATAMVTVVAPALTDFRISFNTQVDPADLDGKGPQPTSFSQQRSDVREIVIDSDVPIALPSAGDLVLTNLGVNAPADDADAVVPLSDVQLELRNGGTTLTISFAAGQLEDGVYQLELLSAITGGANFTFTGNTANRFYVLTGDWNGDGGVDEEDLMTFRYWFGNPVPTAPDYVDVNGTGGINVQDFAGFATNFNIGVIYADGTPGSDVVGNGEGDVEAAIRAMLSPRGAANRIPRSPLAAEADWSRFDDNQDGQVTPSGTPFVVNRADGGPAVSLIAWVPRRLSFDNESTVVAADAALLMALVDKAKRTPLRLRLR